MKRLFALTVAVLLVVGSVGLVQPAAGSSEKVLEKYWHQNYGNISLPKDTCDFSWERLAKAKVDECFYGLQDPRNRPSFNSNFPHDFTDTQVQACIADPPGHPKVNQAYVWGLAKSGDNVWFGTVANTLCLVFNGFYGPLTPQPMVNSSWACEMNFKDVRPPRIFMYDTKTWELKDMTQSVLDAGDPHKSLLLGTTGLRSAGALGDVVFLGGIGGGGVRIFAFNSQTGAFLGSQLYSQYNNIRQWREINNNLYTGMGKSTGGEILRWVGSVAAPFQFETVGNLSGDPAYLVEHKNRIFASTWGGPADSGGTVLYMSPDFGDDQKLSADDASGWKIVWQLSEYEVEPAAFQVGGALESYGDYLYWGTMHVPGTGLVYFAQMYPEASVDAAAFLGTYRPIVIFRGKKFDTDQQKVELLYGTPYLPKYNKDAAQWKIVRNNMKQTPKFGLAGINNFFNNYTWSMQLYQGKLFVGTMDWLYLGGVIAETLGVDIPESIHKLAKNFDGADLYSFVSPDKPAKPVSLNGLGNYLNYGIRTMIADDFLYLGTANPMNMATDPGQPNGGWELYKLKVETHPSKITKASASPSVLWPPNHKMVNVTVNYRVEPSDTECALSVTNNESNSDADFIIVDDHHVKLRAERSGEGDGRIYTITITCGTATRDVTVTVPHDKGKDKDKK